MQNPCSPKELPLDFNLWAPICSSTCSFGWNSHPTLTSPATLHLPLSMETLCMCSQGTALFNFISSGWDIFCAVSWNTEFLISLCFYCVNFSLLNSSSRLSAWSRKPQTPVMLGFILSVTEICFREQEVVWGCICYFLTTTTFWFVFIQMGVRARVSLRQHLSGSCLWHPQRKNHFFSHHNEPSW